MEGGRPRPPHASVLRHYFHGGRRGRRPSIISVPIGGRASPTATCVRLAPLFPWWPPGTSALHHFCPRGGRAPSPTLILRIMRVAAPIVSPGHFTAS